MDLAINRYSNPCSDICYFLYLCTMPQLRRTHLRHLLGRYHDTFVRCLAELGEDPAVYPFRYVYFLQKLRKKFAFFI